MTRSRPRWLTLLFCATLLGLRSQDLCAKCEYRWTYGRVEVVMDEAGDAGDTGGTWDSGAAWHEEGASWPETLTFTESAPNLLSGDGVVLDVDTATVSDRVGRKHARRRDRR